MKWIWLILAAIFAVAAVSVWFAFQNPEFVTGLIAAAVSLIIKELIPGLSKVLAPASKEELEAIKKSDDRGNERDRLNKGSGRPFDRPKE